MTLLKWWDVAYVGRGRILPNTCLVTLDFPALNIMTMIDNGVCMSALTASGADPYIVELSPDTVRVCLFLEYSHNVYTLQVGPDSPITERGNDMNWRNER